MREHGLPSTYRHGCRCEQCRMSHVVYQRDERNPRPGRPDRVELWRVVYEAGIAGRVCDEIVSNRPVPAALVDALIA